MVVQPAKDEGEQSSTTAGGGTGGGSGGGGGVTRCGAPATSTTAPKSGPLRTGTSCTHVLRIRDSTVMSSRVGNALYFVDTPDVYFAVQLMYRQIRA